MILGRIQPRSVIISIRNHESSGISQRMTRGKPGPRGPMERWVAMVGLLPGRARQVRLAAGRRRPGRRGPDGRRPRWTPTLPTGPAAAGSATRGSWPARCWPPPAAGRLRQGHLWDLVRRLARDAGIQAWDQLSPALPAALGDHLRPRRRRDPARRAGLRRATRTTAPPAGTTTPATAWTATPPTRSRPTSPDRRDRVIKRVWALHPAELCAGGNRHWCWSWRQSARSSGCLCRGSDLHYSG